MSPHVIALHLVEHFGKYAGPSKCLRPAQISGWIQSEVGRRKKACVTGALLDASVGAVEAAEVGPKKSKAPPELIEALDLSNTLGCVEGESCAEFVTRQKRLWLKRRPAPDIVAAPSPQARKVISGQPLKATPVVSEVLNKRGRRCIWEYECRWVGCGADETTWESVDDLSSPAASLAVQKFEAAIKSQSRCAMRCSAQKPIRSECCNTIVEYETYDENKGKCRDTDACMARRRKMCEQPTSKRHRVPKKKYD
jgi:hypothetical protein